MFQETELALVVSIISLAAASGQLKGCDLYKLRKEKQGRHYEIIDSCLAMNSFLRDLARAEVLRGLRQKFKANSSSFPSW